MDLEKGKRFIFLKEVFFIAITAFGGPQAHFAVFVEKLVKKRNFISESALLELIALCQILPGPTSTQTITALGYKLGGARLAFFTLLLWILPASTIMLVFALIVNQLGAGDNLHVIKYLQPIALGLMINSVLAFSDKVTNSKSSFVIFLIATVLAFLFPSPYVTPLLIFLGGLFTSLKFKRQEKFHNKEPLNVKYLFLILWLVFFIGSALIGKLTHSLPVRLFENFYRNGSLTFGGGHVLKPLLLTEFVEFKKYLTTDEFMAGIGISEIIPGPVFSFATFVGALSMRSYGMIGQMFGGLAATIGIFLPGSFMIFFLITFWDELKKYRGVRASLEGISAVSVGLSVAAILLIYWPTKGDILNFLIIITTFLILKFTKIPSYVLIIIGFLTGIFI